MITQNPSGPEGEKTSKSFDTNAIKKLEELGLSNKVSKDLASLRAEMSDSERNDKVARAVEQQFPGQDNSKRIENAMKTLEQSRDKIANKLSKQSKAERISLAKNIDTPDNINELKQNFTKSITSETSDGLKAFFGNSVPQTAKIIGKFFTDIPKSFSNIPASAEYILAKADGVYKEPKTKSNDSFTN